MEDAAETASRIFISYRREDSSGHVLALLPPLRRRFGATRIFKDTDNIPPGEDFVRFIKKELESCSVLLAIIGREWLTVQDPRLQRRRLDNPEDFLRVEVGTALSRDTIRVIPVLVERATMPAPQDLPPDLAALSHRNAIELSDLRWETDVQLLIDAIERALGLSSGREPGAARPNATPGSSGPGISIRPEVIELQKRRAREISGHLAFARQALESRDFDAVLQGCEKVLLLDPEHSEALSLLDVARKAIDERKISAWLQQAQTLLNKGEIGDSSDLIDQALAVDNTSEAALALRKEMLNYRREREREREKAKAVAAATDQARGCLDDGDLEGAVRYADDALTSDPEAVEAREIRAKATDALQQRRAQRELRRRAQQAVAEARELMSTEPAAALRKLRDYSPAHEVVTEALEELQAKVDVAEARQQKVADLTTQAETSLTARQFERALAFLSEAVQLDPQRADLVALLAEATRKQYAAASADSALADAALKFAQGDLVGARDLVNSARGSDPRNPQIEGWLRRIDDAVEAEATAVRRTEAINAALVQAREQFAKGDLPAALRQAEAALALDPGLAQAQTLAAQVRGAIAEQREREELERRAVEASQHARELFAARDYEGALRALDRFTPPHPRVTETLAALREELRAIEARRQREQEEAARRQQDLERARLARERAAALDAILARGHASLESGDPAGALRSADEALQMEPKSPDAVQLRASAEALRDRLVRQEEKRREEERREQDRLERERQARETAERERRREEAEKERARQEHEREQQERQERTRREREHQEREREELERQERAQREDERRHREENMREPAIGAKTAEPLVADSATGRDQSPDTTARTRHAWLAAAMAVLVAASVGIWFYVGRQQSAPPAPSSKQASDSPASGEGARPGGPKITSQPQPTAEAPGAVAVAESPTPPTNEALRQQQLERLRETVREKQRTGERVQALSAASEALALQPDDQEVNSIVERLLTEAVKAGEQAKSKALATDAPRLAKDLYGRGLRYEQAGDRSRVRDKTAATRSFWAATEAFDAAARHAASATPPVARKGPPEENHKSGESAPVEVNRVPQPAGASTTPSPPPASEPEKKTELPESRPTAPEKPATIESPRAQAPAVSDDSRIRAVIARYELGYDSLDASIVRSVYPGVRSDLAGIFATYQFYRLEMVIDGVTISPDNTRAVVRCSTFHIIRPKINARDQKFDERLDFTLEKQGDNWVIVAMRKR